LDSGSNDTGNKQDYGYMIGMDPDEKTKINSEINEAKRHSIGIGFIPEAGFYDV